MMTQRDRNQVVAKTLHEVSSVLREEKGGVFEYRFKKLADRLDERAQEYLPIRQ